MQGEGHRRAEQERADRAVRDRQRHHRELSTGHPEVREPDRVGAEPERQLAGEERLQRAAPPGEDRVLTRAPEHGKSEADQDARREHRAGHVPPEASGVRREGAQDHLAVHHRHRETAERHESLGGRRHRGRVPPPGARDHGHGDEQGEEELRETTVHDGQGVLEEDDPQPSDESLDRDEEHGQEPEPAHPPTRVPERQRDAERHREHADPRAEEPVPVLHEHAPDHPRPRKEEGIVPEGRGPVGHGERRARVGDEAAGHDQADGRAHRPARQAVRPARAPHRSPLPLARGLSARARRRPGLP